MDKYRGVRTVQVSGLLLWVENVGFPHKLASDLDRLLQVLYLHEFQLTVKVFNSSKPSFVLGIALNAGA